MSSTADEDATSSSLLGTSATSSPQRDFSPYASVAEEAAVIISEISTLPESRGPLRGFCGDLVRRVRLLSPLLDEIRDGAGDGFPDLVECLGTVHYALVCARNMLRSVYDDSKIYQVITSY